MKNEYSNQESIRKFTVTDEDVATGGITVTRAPEDEEPDMRAWKLAICLGREIAVPAKKEHRESLERLRAEIAEMVKNGDMIGFDDD